MILLFAIVFLVLSFLFCLLFLLSSRTNPMKAFLSFLKWLGGRAVYVAWFALYAAMWMSASMLMTRMFNWPLFHRPMTGYQQTIPGQISGLIGASLPCAFTGIVLGPIGPFAVALQQMSLNWGLAYDAAIAESHDTHPEWTDEERRAVASQAADGASKLPGIVAFGLGVAVIVIAWLTWPRLKAVPESVPPSV